MASGFRGRLEQVLAVSGHLCVGIDPHAALLERWGLPDSAAGARELGLRVVDAAAGRVGVVKPQVAFFERHGPSGYAALETVQRAARDAGLLVIADAKRGDIGTTVAAYGEAWLSPGGPLEADALTVVAYQGLGSLEDVLVLAERHGKGLFVLTATSNPEAEVTQRAIRSDGRTVASGIVSEVVARASDGFGVVIAATVDVAGSGIALDDLAGVPVLAPGFGAQGAALREFRSLFGPVAATTVANVSRSVLGGGAAGLAEAIERANEEVRA